MKMKRLISLFALLLCFALVACDSADSEANETSEISETEETVALVETTGEEKVHILVDWSDFIRVNGVAYDGGWENREVDESRIGEKLGEILYTVKSFYESEEELSKADKRDFTAAFKPIGCAIFALKDDENSIAVLDDGKYYLYTRN